MHMSQEYRKKMDQVVKFIKNLIEKYPRTNEKVVVDYISNELDKDSWLKSYNTLLDTLLKIDERQYSFGPQIRYISTLLQAHFQQADSDETGIVSLGKIDTYTRLISQIAHMYTTFVSSEEINFQKSDSEFIAQIESLDVEASQDVAYGAMRRTLHLMFINLDEKIMELRKTNITESDKLKNSDLASNIATFARKYTFITEKRRGKRETPQKLQLNSMQKCVKYTEDFKQCFMSLAVLLGQSIPGNGRGVVLKSDTSTHRNRGGEVPVEEYNISDFNWWWTQQMELKRYFETLTIHDSPYRVPIVHMNHDMFETVETLNPALGLFDDESFEYPEGCLARYLTQLKLISDIIYLKYEFLSIQPNQTDRVPELENKCRGYFREIEAYVDVYDKSPAYEVLEATFNAIPATNIAYKRIEAIREDINIATDTTHHPGVMEDETAWRKRRGDLVARR